MFYNSFTKSKKLGKKINKKKFCYKKRKNNNKKNEIDLEYKFFCLKKKRDINYEKIEYNKEKNIFYVYIYSQKSCGENLEILKKLFFHKKKSSLIFFILGILISFFGFYIIKKKIIFFIFFIFIISSFYFYLGFIDKSQNDIKFYLLLNFSFFFILICFLMIVYKKFIIIFLLFLTSYDFSIIFFSLFENFFNNFENNKGEWIFIFFIFFFFICFFQIYEDLCIICANSIIGNSFILLSFHFFGISEYEILINLEYQKYGNFQLDKKYFEFLIIFFLLFFFTTIFNFMIFLKLKFFIYDENFEIVKHCEEEGKKVDQRDSLLVN